MSERVYGIDKSGWSTRRYGLVLGHGLRWTGEMSWYEDPYMSWHALACAYARIPGPPVQTWSFDALEFA